MKRCKLFFLVFALLAGSRLGAATCPDIPLPKLAASAEVVCHRAYVALYDSALQLPRLVAYELTGKHSLGCIPRASGFHAELDSAKPSSYNASGYDLGHMMPAQDAAWADDVSHDSFSMINVAPQLPGLNRAEWERLEETVRAWALERGDLLVYVGPVFSDHPKRLGKVAIPAAFFKVVIDRQSGEMLAFELPQKAEAKGDLKPWLTAVTAIEAETGLRFEKHVNGNALWPADLAAWHEAHKKACGQ
jgi:endonuclease G